MNSWILLNIVAWIFGLRAVYDLRKEFDPKAKTWFFLFWAVWYCLIMEISMLGIRTLPGLALFSVMTGIASGALIWLAFRFLQKDICYGQSELFSNKVPDKPFLVLFFVLSGLSLVLGWKLPDASRVAADFLGPVEGVLWLSASAWLIPGFLGRSCRPEEAGIYTPKALALSLAFAFLHSALKPFSLLTGFSAPLQAEPILASLFILTLAGTLYGMAIRVRSRKLEEALTQLQALQAKLFGLEKLVSVGTLAAGAAHDFNNVLTSIIGLSELTLNEKGLPPQTRRDLEGILRSARSATGITQNLMGLARRQTGKSAYSSLRAAVEGPLDLLAKEFARHKIQVVKRIGEAPSGSLDLNLLSQVCLNLYLNARDAMKPLGGGRLEVFLGSNEEGVEISVSDTGTGIPEEFKSRVFQPFQTTKGDQGTGLGLSVSHSVISSMGGRMSFESGEGKGTAFRIEFPAVIPGPQESPSEACGNCVLVVDDQDSAREVVRRMVESMGCPALVAKGGLEALQVLSEKKEIGLVISDVNMPGMGGLELLRRVRSGFPGTKVLLMTGSVAVDLSRTEGPPLQGVLRKPFSLEEIKAYLPHNGSGSNGSGGEK